jgi:predicted phage terminase large subunit-like protein
MWIKNPTSRWLCASHSLDLAIRDSRNCRNLIESEWFQASFGDLFQLSGDQNVKSFFENNMRGYRMSLSVGSKGTGKRGMYLLIDDPNNAKATKSEIDNTVNWFGNTWMSRINSYETGAMIVVGQRLHELDLTGHILSLGGWEHLVLPTEFEPKHRCFTSIGFKDKRKDEGELLWPEKFPVKALNELKISLGALGYSAQFNQSPVPASGGQFKQKWFRYFTDNGDFYTLQTPEGEKRILKSNCQNVATVDLAISLKQTADFTVISIWAVTTDSEVLLIARLRERLDNPEQQKQIVLYHQRYLPSFIDIESTAYQLAIIQQLRAQGLPVREYNPRAKGDKAIRATTAAVLYEAGRVYHPLHVPWLHEWEDELLKFPLAAHDDMVDTVSMVCDSLSRRPNTTTSYKSPWR